jgi:hypothetical protein
MTSHTTIWLQPWCAECDRSSYEGRQWCEDNVWDKCDNCDALPVKYVIAPDQPKPVDDGETDAS